MADRNLVHDPTFVRELVEVVRAGRELCVVLLRAQGGGAKDWYIARDEQDLDVVLGRIPQTGPYGYSDAIGVFATGEFPYRSLDDDVWLRKMALEVIEATGEVAVACKRIDDPELRDVDGADSRSLGVVDEWLGEEHEGERFVGPHPFRHPDGTPGVWWAWNPNADGEIRPGAYWAPLGWASAASRLSFGREAMTGEADMSPAPPLLGAAAAERVMTSRHGGRQTALFPAAVP